jgi:hypothetical protein
MSTKPQTATGQTVHDEFIQYPVHKVVSVFNDPAHVDAAVAELRQNGFAKDDIEAFCGAPGKRGREFEDTKHGVWSTFVSGLHHFGPDRTYVERYEHHLRNGHCMILVQVTSDAKKQRAAGILHRHTEERVTYFGLLMADEIK